MSASKRQRTFSSLFIGSNQAFIEGKNAEDIGPVRIGFILLENFSMMAFTGAVDALVTANLLSSTPLYRFETIGIDSSTVRCDLGFDISVSSQIRGFQVDDLDMIFICGGYRSPLKPNDQLFDLLRTADKKGLVLGGLWNGSLFLAWAGLMDGYECTLHPENRACLEETCPRVIPSTQAFVIDRNRVSCAGASSALNMMLATIKKHYGKNVVRGIEEVLTCDKISEESGRPILTATSDPMLPEKFKEVLQLMESNIEEPLGIDELANFVGLSRRQIERLFHRYADTTPSKYYLELRITRARRLLLQTNESVTSIAAACGFLTQPHLSRCYRDYFGISPTEARQARDREA
ncbi:GlxA family transcriptional regulator [Marinobacterium zhoushanense]|nr:GlxA family transcriptional regulator [Marinobacterium zhoushanense]